MLLRYKCLALALTLLALCACSQPKQPAGAITTLADFEASNFHQTYKLTKTRGWNVNNGGYYHTYSVGRVSDITFGVETRDDFVLGAGVVFYKRANLRERDLTFVYDLLDSLDSTTKRSPELEAYVKANAERNVFQVNEAVPHGFGKFNVYAGKVGNEQHVSIQRAP